MFQCVLLNLGIQDTHSRNDQQYQRYYREGSHAQAAGFRAQTQILPFNEARLDGLVNLQPLAMEHFSLEVSLTLGIAAAARGATHRHLAFIVGLNQEVSTMHRTEHNESIFDTFSVASF